MNDNKEVSMKPKIDDKLSKEKEDIINSLIDMFPELEFKKEKVTESVTDTSLTVPNEIEIPNTVTKSKPNETDYASAEMVFDVIEYEGKHYYLNEGGIWDEKANLIGSLLGYDSNSKPIISFFNAKIQKEIPPYLEKIFSSQ
jgi:hypothetical protein